MPTEDWIGFASGDANLARYVGNGPLASTDPTGRFFVSKSKKEADSFKKYLQERGVNNIEIVRGNSQFYVFISPCDWKAIFQIADDELPHAFDIDDSRRQRDQLKTHRQFVTAAAVLGENYQPQSTSSKTVEIPKEDNALIHREIARRNSANKCGRFYHVDSGGEGRYDDAVNFNIRTRKHDAPDEAIPHMLCRPTGRAPLPAAPRSIDKVTLENTPLSPETAREIAVAIKPGGTIHIHGTTDYLAITGENQIGNLWDAFEQEGRTVQYKERPNGDETTYDIQVLK